MPGSTVLRLPLVACLALPCLANARPGPSARSCDPAVIDSVITNSPLCAGDHINLAVVATGDILGYSWEGPGTGTFFTFEPQYSFSFQILGEYTIIVYGQCGNDTATVTMTAQGAGAGVSDTVHLCDDSPPLDLSTCLGTHAPGGFWTINGSPHGNVYDPGADEPGDYMYTVPFPVTCPGAAQNATITVQETRVGPNATWTLCATDSAFNMMLALEANVDTGGTWYRMQFLSLFPHTATYTPAVDSSGIFRYELNGCSATVQVTEWPAFAWFADADSDGLGDPLAELMACTQPPGFVADSTDLCPALIGTVGSPCDDGNALTFDDQITDSCTCAGDLHTGISSPDESTQPVSAWPNPFAGGELHVQCGWAGEATVRLFDAVGQLVWSAQTVLQGEAITVQPAVSLAPGVYLLSISAEGLMGTVQLMVQ
ncbi:MAG: T9SS type A sorting domain-containing protein [Bacteroidetes bacterium]|nr:T9SS type A sorting domain-containing protein [Bacteroidota bacterium]